jgi:tRNA pseudouridine38-40 synthase
MPSFRLTIAYDGTDFVGWQRQASGVSIQGVLEEALGILDGRDVPVMGAGRTDAGVHARGQVASVTLVREIDAASLVRAVNARLPQTVRVVDAAEVPARFHARFNARAKTYHYRIWNGEVMDPFLRAYTWHIPSPALELAAMNDGAALLRGRHDFSAFQAAETDAHSPERTVFTSRLASEPPAIGTLRSGRLLTYEISGDGFLRHMVRSIVGTLVEVGRGRQPSSWVGEVLASRNRSRAGRTAPAEGLCLMSVDYDYNENSLGKNPHVA